MNEDFTGKNVIGQNSDITFYDVNYKEEDRSSGSWISPPVSFTGSQSSYGSIQSNEVMITGSFTWMAAVKIDVLQAGPLYNVNVGDAFGAHVWVFQDALYMAVPDVVNGNHNQFFHSRLLEINTWYRFGASWDVSTKTETLYVNGEVEEKVCPTCGSETVTSEDASLGVR